MAVTIIYLAWVREMTGIADEQLDSLPANIGTPAQLASWLARRSEGHAQAFADPSRLRCAVDQIMVPLDAPLGAASEIAFFPPVTGG
jgi:sulfur-carrier protein